MATRYKCLRKLVDVHLNATCIWKEKVAHHCYSKCTIRWDGRWWRFLSLISISFRSFPISSGGRRRLVMIFFWRLSFMHWWRRKNGSNCTGGTATAHQLSLVLANDTTQRKTLRELLKTLVVYYTRSNLIILLPRDASLSEARLWCEHRSTNPTGVLPRNWSSNRQWCICG